MPYEPVLLGSVVVCVRCLRGDGSRSPLFPSWLMARHDAWHDAQAGAGEPVPVLEAAS